MSSLLTINYYVNLANTFVKDVCNTATSYYVFVSHPEPWTDANGNIDEQSFQIVNNSVSQLELDTYNELLYGKRISNTDISQAIRRIDWASNTVYDAYDPNDGDLYNKDFFVVTTDAGDEYNVYKCIYNNNDAKSTVKPSSKSIETTFTTADGYIWKYLFTVDAGANNKFTTSNFIPLGENANVQGNAIPGTIDAIKIRDSGLGYQVYQTGQLQAVVDRYTLKISSNSSIFNDYYTGSSIYLKTGYVSGQLRSISGYNGSSKNIVISEPIDLYVKLGLANTPVTGSATVNQIASQTYDTVDLVDAIGYFNPGSNLVQSDTEITARVLKYNGNTQILVSRANKTTEFDASYPFRAIGDLGSITSPVNLNILGSLSNNAQIIINPGSGYTGNTTVTITANVSGSGASANAIANSSGKIASLQVTAGGTNYTFEPTITVTAPVAQTFNSNNIVSNAIPIVTANNFSLNDFITYTRALGNSNIGISNGNYYVSYANNTHIALSTTLSGANIALTNTATTETGHTIQGQTATARLYPDNLYVVNATSNAISSEYSNNDYIRVGSNANTNIRKVVSANSTLLVVDIPFSNSLGTNVPTYKISTAAKPNGISIYTANAVITNSNLNSVKLVVGNVSPAGESFIVGEKVNYVNYSNVSLNANGIVAYSNSSTVYLSDVLGTWNSNNRIKGVLSDVTADVIVYDTQPSIIVKNPSNNFVIGYPVDFTLGTTPQGSVILADITDLSAGVTDYEIGPKVTIQGDGTGALAIAQVDTSNNSGNTINKITVINPGSYYTQANVIITSNTSYGSGASAIPVVSPVKGHGADPEYELGSRYVVIDTKFEDSATEEWKFPTNLQFRKVGIIKDVAFANATLTVDTFQRAELNLVNKSVGSWIPGEVVYQDLSNNATGIVVSGNNTYLQLKGLRGTFATANQIIGLSSGITSNVTSVSSIVFTSNTTITQSNTLATATVVSTVDNTTLYVANIQGHFVDDAEIYSGNSYATVNTITSTQGANISYSFGRRFNQTSRVTLSSNSGSYSVYEYVSQGSAAGKVISTTNDLDLEVASGVSINPSDVVSVVGANSTGYVIFANSSYLKLTGVTDIAGFTAGATINTQSVSTTISNVFPVLVISDVTKDNNFAVNSTSINGNTANGIVKLVIEPDLVRESGKVVYTESSNTIVDRTVTSQEEVRLVIKF
jgi:hypothetical protein